MVHSRNCGGIRAALMNRSLLRSFWQGHGCAIRVPFSRSMIRMPDPEHIVQPSGILKSLRHKLHHATSFKALGLVNNCRRAGFIADEFSGHSLLPD
jgi:hypothetical protein